MNANMRLGHFGRNAAPNRRAEMALLKTALAGLLMLATASSASAWWVETHDTQLEMWAKQQVAKQIGDLRDGYDRNEQMRFVTRLDIRRGPLPLSADRWSDPIYQMANLRDFGSQYAEPEIAAVVITITHGAKKDKPLTETPDAAVEVQATNFPTRKVYGGAFADAGW
jgi:hypothetical protein